MQTISLHHHHSSGFHPMQWIIQATATHHQRARLDKLDDHLLADIGLDRMSAHEEAHRPFWDLS
ncbi:MAG: DUF1127 domain-containing protein [Maritimibacter sp.]